LTKESSLNSATLESVAQFYQVQIFKDIKQSKQTQKALGIDHKFEEMYQEAKDAARLGHYFMRLYQYTITVLADKSFGTHDDPKVIDKKVEKIAELSLDESYARTIVEKNKYNYDSKGNLDFGLVSELRYCAQPVQRALQEFEKNGIDYVGKNRSSIDLTLLNGLWTPTGFVDNARLVAKDMK
jgi:hypothetical protein